jgi:hypothetical protein
MSTSGHLDINGRRAALITVTGYLKNDMHVHVVAVVEVGCASMKCLDVLHVVLHRSCPGPTVSMHKYPWDSVRSRATLMLVVHLALTLRVDFETCSETVVALWGKHRSQEDEC